MRLTRNSSTPTTQPAVREHFDRLVDRFFNGDFLPARDVDTLWIPSLDFSETDKEYVVRLEAPGIPKDDLDVRLDGQTLTLSGRRDFANEEKTEDFFWREREQGRFVRVLQLPATVDPDRVEARYDNGMMTVRLAQKGCGRQDPDPDQVDRIGPTQEAGHASRRTDADAGSNHRPRQHAVGRGRGTG